MHLFVTTPPPQQIPNSKGKVAGVRVSARESRSLLDEDKANGGVKAYSPLHFAGSRRRRLKFSHWQHNTRLVCLISHVHSSHYIMGNCMAKHQHVPVGDGASTALRTPPTLESKLSSAAFPERGDFTDSTESDTAYPPDSLTEQQRPSMVYALQQESSPLHESSPSSRSSSSTTSHPKPGRALRARLEKSRNLQDALHTKKSQEEPSLYQFSMSADSVETSLQQQFEAAASGGTICAELGLDDDDDKHHIIRTCALSRQGPTLDRTRPPLFVAVGSEDGTVRVTELLEQDASSEKQRLGDSCEAQLEGRVRSLDFSPDGRYLAVGGDDCLCTVWRLYHQQQPRLEVACEFERVDRVYAVQFSPDGRYLAMGGFDGTVAIATTRDIADPSLPQPELVAEIASDGLVFALDWSPDAKYLAFGGSDKTCSIVDVTASWRVSQEMRRPASIQCLKWNPSNSRCLAVGSLDVAIVECTSMSVLQEIAVPQSGRRQTSSRVSAVCWSPNGSYLVVCNSTNKCKVLETKSYAAVQEIARSSKINTVQWGQQGSLAGMPRRYLVVGDDQKVAILKAGIELHSGGSDEVSSSFSNASSYFSSRNDGDWELKENSFRDIVDAPVPKKTPFDNPSAVQVLTASFSRGSKSRPSTYFAYATGDGVVTVKTTTDWQTVAELRFPQPVTCLFFSHGSRYLVFGCEDSKVYVSLTAPKWTLLATTELPSPANTVVFSKDNSFVGAGTMDGSFAVLNSQRSYSISGIIDDNDSPISTADWSSKMVAIGREDGTVQLYDTNAVISGDHVPLAEIRRRGTIRSVAFGLGGRFLAVGTSDGLVGVYSAKGGWVMCHQLRYGSGVASLRWNPNSRFLAIGDDRGSLRLLDTVLWSDVNKATRLFARTAGASSSLSPVSSLSFSQDGKLLALAQSDRGVTVADTSDWKLVFSSRDEETIGIDDESPSVSSFDYMDLSVE